MAVLYLDRKDLHLELDAGRLLIREPGERPRGVPLKLIERLVLRGRMTLDSSLLGALGEQGVALVVLSGRHSRRMALLHGAGHNDARRRLAQYRMQTDTAFRLAVSKGLLSGKFSGQRRLLREALELRPDCRKALLDSQRRQDALFLQLSAAADLDQLRGIEGAAAAAHFAALATLLPPELNFSGRNRRPPRDPVNACLSLGYTLLHAEAVSAAYGAGLDPLLGVFHEPVYGRESLACDLIEPLRPRVDVWVWRLFAEQVLRAHQFSRDGEACLLGKTGRQAFYQAWEQQAPGLRRYLRRQAFTLARTLLTLAPDWPVTTVDDF